MKVITPLAEADRSTFILGIVVRIYEFGPAIGEMDLGESVSGSIIDSPSFVFLVVDPMIYRHDTKGVRLLQM